SGRSSIARGRVAGERPASIQTQGSDGRHHQGSEAALLLPETGREASAKASSGTQTCPKEESKRARLDQNDWAAALRSGSFFCRSEAPDGRYTAHAQVSRAIHRPP